MKGVGQYECARPRCHFGLNHSLAQAQFAEHGCYIDPTAKTDDTKVGWVRLEVHVRPRIDFLNSSSFY